VTALAKLQAQVAAALARAGWGQRPTTLVVAASGGPDSSALLYCLHRLQDSHRLKLHVAHLNHNFRGEEAYEDARFAARMAQDLGLPATVEKREAIDYQRERGISSFEQAARELRYAFVAEVAGQVGAAAVAVGHTADDLAETVLLHILRGTGLHGLRGMAELSSWPWPQHPPGLRLFRPLLEATKEETAACCRELGRSYREDSGNTLPRFTRNRVRHQLLPQLAAEYNPQVRQALVRLARSANLELDFLEGELDKAWPRLAPASLSGGALALERRALLALHPLLQRLALRRGYALAAEGPHRLEEPHLLAMSQLAQQGHSGQSMPLPGGYWLHVTANQLVFTANAQLPCPYPMLSRSFALALPDAAGAIRETLSEGWRVRAELLAWDGMTGDDPLTAYLDPACAQGGLAVRARQHGDRFQPLGMAQEKKLQDYLTDSKMPRSWRDRVPLVAAQRGIAWVVGCRIAHWSRVPEDHPVGAPVLRLAFQAQQS